MKINAPKIPMRLPTNSIVSFKDCCVGANNMASMAPTIIIGIPTPTEICFEVILCVLARNLYEFYESNMPHQHQRTIVLANFGPNLWLFWFY